MDNLDPCPGTKHRTELGRTNMPNVSLQEKRAAIYAQPRELEAPRKYAQTHDDYCSACDISCMSDFPPTGVSTRSLMTKKHSSY